MGYGAWGQQIWHNFRKVNISKFRVTLYNAILRIARNFLETRENIKNIRKKKIFFCFIPMKISPNLYGRMDGSKFWFFPWFPENSLLCVILRYTVYVLKRSFFGVGSWNIILNLNTFSVGGCWGQSIILFWKQMEETQMSTPPEATRHQNSK